MSESLRIPAVSEENGVHQIPRHQLRALKLRIRVRRGLPDPLIPEVPEDDWEGLTRLRYALAVMRHREKDPPSPPQSTGPEMSGVYTRCSHPLDRLARLPPLLPAPEPRRVPRILEARP